MSKITKIKKLLALSKSSNINEAALALSRAQRLMREYNLTDLDLIVSTHKTKGAPSNARKIPSYMSTLAFVVAKGFGCDYFFNRSFTGWASNRPIYKLRIEFVGVGERPEVAAYAFDVLRRQLVDARKQYLASQNKKTKRITRITRADAFCLNWVYAASNLLSKFEQPEAEQKLVANYMEKMNLTEAQSKETKKCNGVDSAACAGYEAGLNAKLNHAVKGSGHKKLGVSL